MLTRMLMHHIDRERVHTHRRRRAMSRDMHLVLMRVSRVVLMSRMMLMLLRMRMMLMRRSVPKRMSRMVLMLVRMGMRR